MMLSHEIESFAIIAALVICYYLLWDYLNSYYQGHKNVLFYFSFIPIIWIIPLIVILIKGNKSIVNK